MKLYNPKKHHEGFPAETLNKGNHYPGLGSFRQLGRVFSSAIKAGLRRKAAGYDVGSRGPAIFLGFKNEVDA